MCPDLTFWEITLKIMPSLKLGSLVKLCHVGDVTQWLSVLFVYRCGFQLEAFVMATDTDYRRKCRVAALKCGLLNQSFN